MNINKIILFKTDSDIKLTKTVKSKWLLQTDIL